MIGHDDCLLGSEADDIDIRPPTFAHPYSHGCMCTACAEREADSFLAKRESNRMFGRNADPALCVPVIYATPTAEPVPCASCASLAAKNKHCWRHT